MKFKILLSIFVLNGLVSCRDCTECTYYIAKDASSDTIVKTDSFCGSSKVVKDYEDYFKEQAENQAFLTGGSATVNCIRVDK